MEPSATPNLVREDQVDLRRRKEDCRKLEADIAALDKRLWEIRVEKCKLDLKEAILNDAPPHTISELQLALATMKESLLADKDPTCE